jgi:hypothetical protein
LWRREFLYEQIPSPSRSRKNESLDERAHDALALLHRAVREEALRVLETVENRVHDQIGIRDRLVRACLQFLKA